MAEASKSVAKTVQERQADAKAERLARVDEQVASGDLVIRQMTKAERAKWAERRAARAAKVAAGRAA